jgi:urease accessory protein
VLSTIQTADIFAANRASGRIALNAAAAGGRTRRTRVHEDGSLRVRFPNVAGEALEAVIVNTGGGMTGGDRFSIEMAVGEGARLIAGTAAAEKIYRSTGPDAEMTVRLTVGAGGRLAWLPQECILFDGARLQRRIDIDLAEGAALVMAEAVVFGRAAMGEAVAEGLFSDRWRLRRGGRLVFADAALLDGAIAAKLAEAAVAAGGGPRARRAICRRGRHFGLERHRRGAAGCARRLGVASRSHRRLARARHQRPAALAPITHDPERWEPVFG